MRTSVLWLLLTLAFGIPVSAQSTNSDWLLVKNLGVEQAIEVKTDRGKTIKGSYIAATDETLSLAVVERGFMRRSWRQVNLPRTEVKQVRLLRRAASAVAGGVIGAVAGGAAFAAMDRPASDMRAVVAAVGVMIGAPVGAVVGRETSFIKGSVIYRAP